MTSLTRTVFALLLPALAAGAAEEPKAPAPAGEADAAFNRAGDMLAYTVDAVSKVGNGLFVQDLRTGRVIPLDGTETFMYTEHWGDVREVAVSPNGRYIAHGWNTVWLQPVSPQTLHPNGPAKKLLDLVGDGHGTHANWSEPLRLRWTQDSQVVFFRTYAEGRFHQYAFSAATGDPVPYPDAASTGLRSPDGKCLALTDIDGSETLAVSIAAHSPLMAGIVREYRAAVDATDFCLPAIPVVANISARPLLSVDEIRDELAGQLTWPVRWTAAIQWMVERGVRDFVEVGPKEVLAGLVRRTDGTVQARSIGSLAAVQAAGLGSEHGRGSHAL